MRRILIIGTAMTMLAVPAGAQASCGTVCLKNKVNTLTREVNSLTGQIGTLNSEVNSLTTTVGSLNTLVTTAGTNITSIHNAQVTDEGNISKLQTFETAYNTCLAEAPITRYQGYVYDADGNGNSAGYVDTTALDATASGDSVSAWVMYDQCNTEPTAQIVRGNLARSTGQLAPSFLLPPFAR